MPTCLGSSAPEDLNCLAPIQAAQNEIHFFPASEPAPVENLSGQGNQNEKVEDASNLGGKMINKIIDKSLAKWHKENAEILDNSATVVRKNENENDSTSSDNLEEAKIWAQNRGDRP